MPSQFSLNLPGRWQIGCNGKCKVFSFWILLGVGGRLKKGHLCLGPSFTKCKIMAKWIYLTRKENCVILAR